MRQISVVNYVSLDGVIQSPADADEDRSGGFEHGGWVVPYLDEVWGKAAGEGMSAADTFLFGRKTYEKMAAHWPNQSDDDPIAALLNRSTKYVVSTTLDEVSWQNSILIKDDVVAEVTKVKNQPGGTITVLGSGELIQTLMQHDLVDQFTLVLFPIVLGTGKRLFKEGLPKTPLKLVDSTPTTTGGLILVYGPPSR